MTRSEKEETLNCYCNSIDDCDDCELMKKYDRDTSEFTDQYSCIFHKMSDNMLNKCYNWYKELDPAACENAETKCCDKEPNVDMVNHPSHYTQGGIECIDALKAATVSKTGIEAVCTANAIKYLKAAYDYFSDNTKIIINKSNKTIDILIPM